MPLFKINNSNLDIIKESTFKLEGDIQALIESNLETLFGLEFVATERVIEGLRIDTLAYSKEDKTFVIIEYKRDSSFSIVDQGMSYLSLLFQNKADFVLEYNELTNNNLKREDVDWSQARIIFIAPTFTTHQINAINFKDLPFELWEVSKYENDLLSLKQVIKKSPNESLPILETSGPMTSIKKETREYSEEGLFGKKLKTFEIYKELKERLSTTFPELLFDVKSSSVNVKHSENWRVITYIAPYSNHLRLTFTRSLPENFTDPQKKIVFDAKSTQHYNQNLTYLDIKNTDNEDIEYGLEMFRQAYKRYRNEFIESA